MVVGYFGIFYAFSLRVVALQSARCVSEQVCGAPGAGAEQRSDHPGHRHCGGLLRRALAQVRTLFCSPFTNNPDCLQVFLPDAVRGAPAPPQVRPGDDVHGGAAREGVPQEQAQGRITLTCHVLTRITILQERGPGHPGVHPGTGQGGAPPPPTPGARATPPIRAASDVSKSYHLFFLNNLI